MIVLDTSVIISALYSRNGQSNKLFFHCLDGNVEYAISPLLLWEYIGKVEEKIDAKVLSISKRAANTLLKRLMEQSVLVHQPVTDRPILPDPADDKVLECAISSNAEYIVTFNISDFPKSILKGYSVRAVLPKTFLKKEKML